MDNIFTLNNNVYTNNNNILYEIANRLNNIVNELYYSNINKIIINRKKNKFSKYLWNGNKTIRFNNICLICFNGFSIFRLGKRNFNTSKKE